MAIVRTYSLRDEDTELLEWLKEEGKTTPGGESGVVREALYQKMRDEAGKAGQLDRIEDRILAVLEILKGREQ